MNEPTHDKHTMKSSLLFVGLDVHAQSITLAVACADGSEARLYGTIPNDLHALEKVFAKLRKAHPGAELRVCYEAGPTGFVLARQHYRLAPKISKELSVRQEGLSADDQSLLVESADPPAPAHDAALARGKQRNKVTVAVARELTGFVWQIFQLMAPRMTDGQGASPSKQESRFWGETARKPPLSPPPPI